MRNSGNTPCNDARLAIQPEKHLFRHIATLIILAYKSGITILVHAGLPIYPYIGTFRFIAVNIFTYIPRKAACHQAGLTIQAQSGGLYHIPASVIFVHLACLTRLGQTGIPLNILVSRAYMVLVFPFIGLPRVALSIHCRISLRINISQSAAQPLIIILNIVACNTFLSGYNFPVLG